MKRRSWLASVLGFFGLAGTVKSEKTAQARPAVGDDLRRWLDLIPDQWEQKMRDVFAERYAAIVKDPDEKAFLIFRGAKQLRETGTCLIREIAGGPTDVTTRIEIIPTGWAIPQPRSKVYPEGCYVVVSPGERHGDLMYHYTVDSRDVHRITMIPLPPRGRVCFPKNTSASVAYWIGEEKQP